MYLTKLLSISAGALAGVGLLSVGDLVVPTPQPIEVHALNYIDGIVHQKRTVTAKGEFFPAQWQAAIYSMETGEPVSFCTGKGFWNYSSGYRDAPIPLGEWVGNELCTPDALALIGGEFQPIASWHWGDDETIHIGEVFRP